MGSFVSGGGWGLLQVGEQAGKVQVSLAEADMRVGINRIAAAKDKRANLQGAEPVACSLEAQGDGTGHMRRRETGAVPAYEQAGVPAGAGWGRPGGEHADAGGDEVGFAAAVTAGTGAAEPRDRAVRVVAVVGADDQGQVAGGDGADGGRRVAVVGANLAWQRRQLSSRSIQAWKRPLLTCRASRVIVQFPAQPMGSRYATM